VSRADHSVFVLKFCVTFLVNSLSPVFAGVQLLLSGHSADESVAVVRFVVLMPSFNDQTEGSRPLKVDGELDDLLGHHCHAVVGQHGREPFAEGTLVLRVDGGLVMFQANPESGCTNCGTHSGRSLEPFATMSVGIFTHFVVETFEVKLKNALTPAT
jgi:hypothetical protein